MTKLLYIGPDPWVLPDDSDVDGVRIKLEECLAHHQIVTVFVIVRGVRVPLLLNGHNLTAATAVEVPDDGEGVGL